MAGSRSVTLRLPGDLVDAWAALARAKGTTRTGWLTAVLTRAQGGPGGFTPSRDVAARLEALEALAADQGLRLERLAERVRGLEGVPSA